MEGKGLTGISSIGGSPSLSSTALQIEFNARVASLQKGAQEFEGDLALHLIQSAAIHLDTGQQLDVVG